MGVSSAALGDNYHTAIQNGTAATVQNLVITTPLQSCS